MPITDARKQRTELRLELYENGYTPLPNHNKACFLESWSTVEVTPERIKSDDWARNARLKDTGIRCGDVVAFDFDVDDGEILNDLLDVLVGEDILPETPLVRIGRAPREMWIYRIEGPKLAKRTTGGFAEPAQITAAEQAIAAGGDPREVARGVNKLQVEVLGVGSQFGAFGKHSDHIDYSWPVQSPLEVDIAALPSVTREVIEAVIARSALFFGERGLAQLDLGGGTNDGHYTRVYDLTPDMVFPTKELGAMTVAQLEAYFNANPDKMLRCTVEALRPSTGGSLAGMANLVQGQLCISDHGSYSTHFRADVDPAPKLALLGQKLFERFNVVATPKASPVERRQAEPMMDLSMDPRDGFTENLDLALQRFAYILPNDTIIDTYANTAPMSVTHFRNRMLPFFDVEQTKQGVDKITRLSDAWMQSPDRVDVGSAEMRPDQSWPFYYLGEEKHANTYRPVVLEDAGGDAEIGLEFLRNLVPNADERAYVMQWLSYKLQFPEVRGPAIVMVANATFGTGRGSLGLLLTDMFSERYVNNVDFSTLAGKTYQAQYNEWLVDSLIVVVNEAADNDRSAGSKWEAKNQAYEHLKNIVDPASTRQLINRKGDRNSQGRTFASILVMTNHADALVIPPGDRRFYIVENGANQSPGYWTRFHEWRSNPGNVAALVRALEQVDLTGYNPFEAPPMTRAKAEMIYAGTSELDRAMSAVIQAMPGQLVVRDQVFNAVDRYVIENACMLPDEWRSRSGTSVFNRMTKPVYGAVDRVRLDDGKQHTPRAIGDVDPELLKSAEAMLEEVRKNGTILRSLASVSGNVVPLRGQQGQSNGAATS